VVVGDHDAGRVDDETGAERARAPLARSLALTARAARAAASALAAPVEEVLEQILGVPGGSCGMVRERVSTVVEAEMLTTASVT
jgi:hypothetical protein